MASARTRCVRNEHGVDAMRCACCVQRRIPGVASGCHLFVWCWWTSPPVDDQHMGLRGHAQCCQLSRPTRRCDDVRAYTSDTRRACRPRLLESCAAAEASVALPGRKAWSTTKARGCARHPAGPSQHSTRDKPVRGVVLHRGSLTCRPCGGKAAPVLWTMLTRSGAGIRSGTRHPPEVGVLSSEPTAGQEHP